MEAQSEYVRVAYTFFHVRRRFECSVGDYQKKKKNSESELSRGKFIESALLVGGRVPACLPAPPT